MEAPNNFTCIGEGRGKLRVNPAMDNELWGVDGDINPDLRKTDWQSWM